MTRHGVARPRQKSGPVCCRQAKRCDRVTAMLKGKRILLVDRGRHRGLQVAGAGAAAAQARRVGALRADRGGREVRDAAVAAGADRGQGLHRPVLADRRKRDGPHPALARRGPAGRGAGDGQHPGAHGGGPGRRPRHDRAARHRQAGAGGAGDERAHVDPCRDPGQRRDADASAASTSSARTTAPWPATSTGPAACPSRRRSSLRSKACSRARSRL